MQRVTFLARPRFVVTLVVLFLTVPAWASDTPRDRASLKRISSMQVGVEKIQPDAERDGLTRSQTQTDIESRLRQSGIALDPLPVSPLCHHQHREGPGFPFLRRITSPSHSIRASASLATLRAYTLPRPGVSRTSGWSVPITSVTCEPKWPTW